MRCVSTAIDKQTDTGPCTGRRITVMLQANAPKNNHVVRDTWEHSLDPVFLEGGVEAERYLQLLNGVWEPHVEEMPLNANRSTSV